MFEPAIEQLLAELEELGRENDQRVSERRYKLLNLERPTAELIWLLLQSTQRRRVLEIGTSNGYSTIWIAEALPACRGCALRQHRTLPRKTRAGASEPRIAPDCSRRSS